LHRRGALHTKRFLNMSVTYKSFEFNRDEYQAPVYNPEDFGAAEPEPSPPRQAWTQPQQTQARPKTPAGRSSTKRSASRGRRSPVSKEEMARKGDEAGPVALSNLPPEERERYLDFMMHHEFEFQLDENGEYVATFRQAPAPEPKAVEAATAPRERKQKATPQREVQPRTQSRMEQKPTGPQPRPLSWLLRMIADIYDSRFVLYSTEILTARDISDFESFSSFIFNFLAKKFGLEKLKIQMSKELLMSVAAHRGTSPEVELFGVFLSGQYDACALLFYLFCRWKVLPECAKGVKSEGRYHLQYIPANRFVSLTKQVLAKQPPAMYSEFMKLLEHTYGRRGDRKIEVHQYLLLLLQTFIGFTRGNAPNEFEGDAELP